MAVACGMSRRCRQRGVALAIVVWFLAGMSLLVAGIVYQARVDVKMAQVHAARARAVAAGDGAIQLMLARYLQVSGSRAQAARPLTGNFTLGETSVSVYMVPASGLVNLSAAPAEMLAALFAGRAGISAGEAQQLAASVVKLRASPKAWGDGRSKDAISMEDMLRFPGFDRELLDAVRDDVRAANLGRGVLQMTLASADLRRLLGRGSAGGRNDAGGGAAALASADNNYRVDALIQYGGQIWLRRRWVSFTAPGESALPWQFVRTESPRVTAAARDRAN